LDGLENVEKEAKMKIAREMAEIRKRYT